MRIINAPSLANCSLLHMGQEIAELVEGGADWFHIDVMDGHYVPNLCFSPGILAELREKYPGVRRDVHLMVTDPMAYLARLAGAGADYVSFHLDATSFSRRVLAEIRALGMRGGVVINPSQRVDLLEPLIPYLDYAVLMTVEPGYAGQRFMPDSLPRVTELAALRAAYQSDFLISIDGGVDMENAVECLRRGAEVYVTGIYTVFRQPDGIVAASRRFRSTLENILPEG